MQLLPRAECFDPSTRSVMKRVAKAIGEVMNQILFLEIRFWIRDYRSLSIGDSMKRRARSTANLEFKFQFPKSNLGETGEPRRMPECPIAGFSGNYRSFPSNRTEQRCVHVAQRGEFRTPGSQGRQIEFGLKDHRQVF